LSLSYYQQLKNCRRIGLFDSGVGGLTVLDKLKRLPASVSSKSSGFVGQPREFVYLADTARCPYGNRPPSEILSFISQIVAWLADKSVDGIVVACNTSASIALESTQRLTPVPVFDLITPTAHYVGKMGRKVGVMATTATVRSKAFSNAIQQVAPGLDVLEIACPDLVPIIERGEVLQKSTIAVLEKYAEILLKEKVEVLVWGCTHFPFLKEPLTGLLEHKLLTVDPADVLFNLLEVEADSVADTTAGNAKNMIYVTGDPFEFSRSANICLGYSLDTINGITVEELIDPTFRSTTSSDHPKKSEKITVVPAV
jgi:glutamate racemase